MIGTVLRVRYELTQLLGEGPIFVTYAARDRVFGRDVTIRLVKTPFAGEAEFLAKVKEIVKESQAITHPNVEKLLDLAEDEGQSFLVAEGSRGSTLAERIKKLAPYSVPVSVSMTVSILEGLDAIHKSGHVHGDISGANIVIQADGSARLQVASMWRAYSASATAGAVVLPSMAPYLAPEVSSGLMPNAASDIYAVGILLFQLLSGRHPYPGETPISVALKHATLPTPAMRAINPGVPIALEEVIKKAMAKDPADRYQSATDMLADLRIIEDGVRFGKPLTWPLRGGEKVASRAPVAPKMSAVRPDRPEGKKPAREPGDVPMWMVISLVSVLVGVALLVVFWLGFNLSTPRLVTVPEIRGLSTVEARGMLRQLKLDMRLGTRQTSEKYPADVVLDVNPQPGRQVREGGMVTVRISSGSKFVEVPDLRGRTLDEARSLLSSVNLQLNENVEQARSFNVAKNLIVRQFPEARKKVERQTRIRVTISSGRRPDDRPPTDEAYIYTLRIRLAGISESVVLRVDITDDEGTRTIYENRHAPEDAVEVRARGIGREAVFRIFYDDTFVKQVTKRAGEDEQGSQPPEEPTGGGEGRPESPDEPPPGPDEEPPPRRDEGGDR